MWFVVSLIIRPRKRVFGFALFGGLCDMSYRSPINLDRAGSGSTDFVDLKASRPIEEYLMAVSLASFAINSATASSVKMVSWLKWRASISAGIVRGWFGKPREGKYLRQRVVEVT